MAGMIAALLSLSGSIAGAIGAPRWMVTTALAVAAAALLAIGVFFAAKGVVDAVEARDQRIWQSGYDKADAVWKAKELEAQIDKLKTEIAIRDEADAERDRIVAVIDQERKKWEEKAKEYEDEIAKNGGACPLTQRDLDLMP